MASSPQPTAQEIARAAEALREGRLVVFPTETVYGLGAHALLPEAVAGIFQAKGRPADNPLIVHVPTEEAARALTTAFPPEAERLARAFWPGPLTLVLPRQPGVPDVTTGGLGSVAVRVPGHPVALELLRVAGVPVAAPSANRSGRPSPTRVEHAREDLGASVAVYLDGGPTQVGLESTVVGLLGAPTLLRPGGVPREALEQVLGRALEIPARQGPVLSPGMKYRHYAPRAPLYLATPEELPGLVARLQTQGGRLAVVASQESVAEGRAPAEALSPGPRKDGAAWARALFAMLRDLDAGGATAIVVEQIPEEGLGAAVMNRLRKAAEGK